MRELVDKAILLIACIMVYSVFHDDNHMTLVTPFLLCLTYGSFSTFFDSVYFRFGIFLSYLIICFFWTDYLVFLPFMIYDLAYSEYKNFIYVSLLLILLDVKELTLNGIIGWILILSASFYLKFQTQTIYRIQMENAQNKDTTTELLLLQEEKNRDLLENQDYEVNLALLSERNRISKEMHDNVGHLLSRTLIQIGALMTISKEPVVKAQLENMKVSVSEGMDSVRQTIHNMHDDSVDLYISLQKLVREFTFCEIDFEYDIENLPSIRIRYCLIATVTEALANVMKHSSATKVSLLVAELPAYYKLVIADNGNIPEWLKALLQKKRETGDYSEGMGLHNIVDRVNGLGGSLSITGDDGFRIYMTIPKNKREA